MNAQNQTSLTRKTLYGIMALIVFLGAFGAGNLAPVRAAPAPGIGQIGTTLASATVLGITGTSSHSDQGIQGNFPSAGSHYFFFTLDAAKSVKFILRALTSCSVDMILYAGDGVTEITRSAPLPPSSCDQYFEPSLSAGGYYLVVNGNNSGDGYALTWNYDGSASSKAENISSGFDESHDLEAYNDARVSDWYYVNWSSGQNLILTVDGSSGTDFDIFVYASTNLTTPIAAAQSATYPDLTNIVTIPTSGKIYIKVVKTGGGGAYRLSVTLLASQWRSASSMSTPREYAATVTANGNIYAIGGKNGATYLSAVEFAAINPDGALGAWQPTAPMNNARAFLSAVVAGHYIYAIGGQLGNGTVLQTVERSKINADGSLGAWENLTSNMISPRYALAAVTANGYLYAIGGDNGTSVRLITVERAQILADGTLGDWESDHSVMSNERSALAAVVVGNNLYAIGGWDGSTLLASVIRTTINSDGSLEPWATATGLNTAREFFGASVSGQAIFIYGGDIRSSSLNSVETSTIQPDGQLSNWSPAPSMLAAKTGLSGSAENGYVFSVGGSGPSGSLNNVEFLGPTTKPLTELTINGGFNSYAGISNIPAGWKATNYFPLSDGKDIKIKSEGKASVKIKGTGVAKTLIQELHGIGSAGDLFIFSYYVKGASIPPTKICSGQVFLFNGETLVNAVTLTCPKAATFGFRKLIKKFNALGDYNRVVIRFTYSKSRGTVWFDGASLLW